MLAPDAVKAVDILERYFKQLHEKVGLAWTKDNRKDMVQVVELILETATKDKRQTFGI